MIPSSVQCVIPVFNGEKYIAEAIESALSQAVPSVEVVVVDDGSTDTTPGIVADFGAAIVSIRQARAGVSAARNRGVRAGHSEFVAFLDADDRYHPHKLRDQLAVLESDSTLEFVDAHSQYFWSPELSESERTADPRHAHRFWHETVPGHISSWLVRRRVFERLGYFDETLCFSEDTDWLLRYKDSGGRITTLERCVSYRRLHAGNVTAGHRAEQVRGLARVLQRSRKRRQGAGR